MHLCLIPSHDESWGPSFNWRAEQWRDFILTSQWRLKELLLCGAHQPTHSLYHVRGSPPPRAPAPGWSCPVCCCHAWVPPSPLPSLLSWDGAVKPICSLMCSGCWGYTELQKNAKSCLLCSMGTELSLGSSSQISNNISLAQVEPERQKQDGFLVVCLAGRGCQSSRTRGVQDLDPPAVAVRLGPWLLPRLPAWLPVLLTHWAQC